MPATVSYFLPRSSAWSQALCTRTLALRCAFFAVGRLARWARLAGTLAGDVLEALRRAGWTTARRGTLQSQWLSGTAPFCASNQLRVVDVRKHSPVPAE